MADQLSANEIAVEWGSPEEAEARRVVGLLKLQDPNGLATEVFYGPLVGVDTALSIPAGDCRVYHRRDGARPYHHDGR